MTDPMPGTGAIIPHVVEVEARADVRVVVQDGPWPVDPALRAGGAAHLAALRRRVPAMHDGPVLAMSAVRGGVVSARRAGYFDMVATADALAHDPALRARAAAVAGDIVAAVGREGREELGVAVDPRAVRILGIGWDLARLRPEVCAALTLEAVPARAGGDEFDVVDAFAVARAPSPLTAGAACALALLGKESARRGS